MYPEKVFLYRTNKNKIINCSLRRPRRKIPWEIAAEDGGVSVFVYGREKSISCECVIDNLYTMTLFA